MAVDPNELARLQKDFRNASGRDAHDFCCPITMLDKSASELINGHIINKAIKSESEKSPSQKKTVIQWREIDNYYGRTIEPELIDFVNMPHKTPMEIFFRVGSGTSITTKEGEKHPVFYPPKNSIGGLINSGKFSQIFMPNPDVKGGHFVDPLFVKVSPAEMPSFKEAVMETNITISRPAVTGTFFKAAYLSMFKMLGWRYVFSTKARFLRRPLADFFLKKGTKENAGDFFSQFEGSCNLLLNDALDTLPDTPTGQYFFFHFIHCISPNREMLFAISCLFRLNGQLFTVAVPANTLDDDWPAALSYYFTFIENRSMQHAIKVAQFAGDHWNIAPHPLAIRFNDPPERQSREAQ